MKIKSPLVALVVISLVGCVATPAKKTAATTVPAVDASPQALLDRVRPSLVAVRYTFDGEMGRRELEGAGIVVRADGLVAFSASVVPAAIPDAQMIGFKIVIPPGIDGVDETEIDATFLGRDDRSSLAFIKPAAAGRSWKALAPADRPIAVGDVITSIGLLPKDSGYATYARSSTVSALLRGPIPLVLTDGRLAAVGSPVFDKHGDFVAIVPEFAGQNAFLNLGGEANVPGLENAPLFVVPIRDYLPSLNDPPNAAGSRKVPWLGVVQMTGLKKDVAEIFGLKGRVGVQVGDVVEGGSGAKAGLKEGDVISQVNGEDLERGDTPEELPAILARKIIRMNVGDEVTLTIIRGKGSAPMPIKMTLSERPAIASTAARFYAEDLAFTVRELVFQDRYNLRVDESFVGVSTNFVKPQGSAQAGGLRRGDVITKLNQIDVKNVDQFKQAYEAFRKASPKEAVVMEVLRGSDTQIIRIQPPQ